MTPRVSSGIVNLALAVGVAAVVAIVLVFAVPRHDSGHAPAAVLASVPGGPGTTKRVVYLRLPPMPAAPSQVSDLPSDSLRSSDISEPYEPPAPPMIVAAVPAKRPAGEQVAALTPPESTPSAAPPRLRTVELENHPIHAVPQRDAPVRRVTIVNREDKAAPKGQTVLKGLDRPPPARRHDADKGGTPARSADDATGVKIAGPAIVTGPLELNIAGKPLRLFGVKPPASGDMCAPSADYAARACPDVSRQALLARIGPDGEVTCRILATGGRQALPAVCKDSTGADLATYLVEHGFALAESNDMMIDYSSAETQAKTAHTGLWSYR